MLHGLVDRVLVVVDVADLLVVILALLNTLIPEPEKITFLRILFNV
jgi:hypothetical protein